MTLRADGGAQLGADNTWTGQQTFAAGTITSSKPVTITQTWNNAGVVFTGFKIDITTTAHDATSMFLELLDGGSSRFAIDHFGQISGQNGGIRYNNFDLTQGGDWMKLLSIASYQWSSSSSNIGAAADTLIARAAAKVISIEAASSTGGTFRAIATTPAQITVDQDNYNPGGSSYFQRWSSDASRNVTGLTFTAAQVDGQTHLIVNVGAQDIVLKEQTTSTAANQFLNSTGADITLSAKQAADVIYDGTSARWRVFKRN
jgi:hypothetical protein